ncbi:MbtH family NRPS accessory protein [Lentzea sp. PSKA42]|jgi:MbtH protein|uniref:MbtH family NRPS accessory protein n=1 Tax=Lentzea indica TaxID=2604800 RepID=A0ABX1FF58_9PSEU|nr:MbtH family NRPS accessory protein [Lentzea indica]NKE57578.1 MbtH family NRPS accessory protein [Lentzea indica]
MARADCGRFFRVVVNEEGRYSIWPTDLAVPGGWRPTGFSGTRQACLNQVTELWRDMRPGDETGTE